jgi:hypothetical protein
VIVWAGAALLGFIAGEISVTDPALASWFSAQEAAWGLGEHRLQILVGLLGAVFVVGLGKALLSRRASLTESTPV